MGVEDKVVTDYSVDTEGPTAEGGVLPKDDEAGAGSVVTVKQEGRSSTVTQVSTG